MSSLSPHDLNDVRLVESGEHEYEWHCDHCGMDNTVFTTFLGMTVCSHCRRTSFISEVIRDVGRA